MKTLGYQEAEIEKEIRATGTVEDLPKRVLIYEETESKTFKGWDK